MKRKPAIAAWGSGFFAGCLSHTGSIRGGQAKGPGFSFLEHSPDSLPHLVPGGEFRAKFLKILILPTQCCTCPEAFPRLCSSSVLSHHFSIYSSVLKSDWHLLIEETKSPLGHALASMLQATLFFSSIYMGYLHLKMRGKKQKRGFSFQIPKLCLYLCKQSLSGAAGHWVSVCSLLNDSQFLKQALEEMSQRHHCREALEEPGGVLEMSAHPVLVTFEK